MPFRLIGSDIQSFILEHFGYQYHLSSVYKLLHRLGFSWITSRSKHPKQSIEAQEDFKKFQIETILKIPGHIAVDKVDIWLQDEARFGQQNIPTIYSGSYPHTNESCFSFFLSLIIYFCRLLFISNIDLY
ncbi:winged helix-turn-helix domain-containing protein [Psychromonas sp. RZ22]|uniref:helix-turn-helix domain-containing protein n=1 Tax=Psychromonas algarum TaxID=2555643 RepID=UPI001068ACE2|nr:winged helix-turn-helix domain-containing protein [Psychromonas sp. RZ22]